MAEALAQLRSWRWLLLWLAAAVLVAYQVPTRVPVAPAADMLHPPTAWVLGPGAAIDASGEGLALRGEGPLPVFASRRVAVPSAASFVVVEVCFAEPVAAETIAVLLASVNAGHLDFNRAYVVDTLGGASADRCIREALPRRAGDSEAVLQLQLLAVDTAARILRLRVTAETGHPTWGWTRTMLLAAGLVLVALRFRGFSGYRPRWLAVTGVLTVAGILFGCCVDVGLKADIYALFTGGRVLPVALGDLLSSPFPLGGFTIFTSLHAVLFAIATVALALLSRRAWVDLLLLAIVTETLQLFVPGRGPGLGDVLVDWSGVLLGMLVVLALWRTERIRLFLQHQGIDEDVPRL